MNVPPNTEAPTEGQPNPDPLMQAAEIAQQYVSEMNITLAACNEAYYLATLPARRKAQIGQSACHGLVPIISGY